MKTEEKFFYYLYNNYCSIIIDEVFKPASQETINTLFFSGFFDHDVPEEIFKELPLHINQRQVQLIVIHLFEFTDSLLQQLTELFTLLLQEKWQGKIEFHYTKGDDTIYEAGVKLQEDCKMEFIFCENND